MARHPVIGRRDRAARSSSSPRPLEVVRPHHERWDGTGYPDGLAGEEIPLAARVFAVADVLDALTTDRPYRPASPLAEAREMINRRERAPISTRAWSPRSSRSTTTTIQADRGPRSDEPRASWSSMTTRSSAS